MLTQMETKTWRGGRAWTREINIPMPPQTNKNHNELIIHPSEHPPNISQDVFDRYESPPPKALQLTQAYLAECKLRERYQ